MLTEGYSQDDIKNGFRVDIGTPSIALADRVKMAIAVAVSLLVPFAFFVAILSLLYLCLNLTLSEFQYRPLLDWNLNALLLADGLLIGFLLALAKRVARVRGNNKIFEEVTPESQPELHSFINQIAVLLNCPRPSSVKLDAEVGLVLRPTTLKDAFTGRGPEVVIGLPLLYGLSARQLSGVIAHAYAGYSAEAREVGYPILCTMDRWLFSLAGVGRAADQRRVMHSSVQGGSIEKTFQPFDVVVGWVFSTLYQVVSALTFDVTRQVDFAGDLYSVRMAGSSEFRSTQFRLRSIQYGLQHANQELIKSWPCNKLSDNFPSLIVDHADTLQLTLRPRLIQEMEELVTPLTRSRIVDLGRIVNVEHTQEEGACFLLGSAIALLRYPVQISRAVSISHYRHIGIREPRLYTAHKNPAIQLVEREKAKRNAVFCGLERSRRVVRVEELHYVDSMSFEDRLREYAILAEHLHTGEPVIRQMADNIRDNEYRKNLLLTRKVIERSRQANSEVIRNLETQWLAKIKDQSDSKVEISPFEGAFARRAAIGLMLALDSKAVQQQLQMYPHEMRSHFQLLVTALNSMHRFYESSLRLRSYTQALGQLLVENTLSASRGLANSGEAGDEFSYQYMKYVQVELESLLSLLDKVEYPMGGIDFSAVSLESCVSEGSRPVSIFDMIRVDIPDLPLASTCPEACHRVANGVCQYIDHLNEQMQHRLALILTSVERHYNPMAALEPR